jgi:hypothetical protein
MTQLMDSARFDSDCRSGCRDSASSRPRSSDHSPATASAPHDAPASAPAAAPGDSSVARMRWGDDGGACGPASDGPFFRVIDPAAYAASRGTTATSKHPHDAESPAWRECIELIPLPFAEYSASFPDRLDWLRQRLDAEPAARVRFVIVDATRVTRPGGALLGTLHAAAGRLRRSDRCLVLAGDLCGLVSVSHLGELCHIAASREAAFAWCCEQLGGR